MYSSVLCAYNAPETPITALLHLYDVVNAYASFQYFGPNLHLCEDDSNTDMYSSVLCAYNAPETPITALLHLYDVVNAYASFQYFGPKVVRCNREMSLGVSASRHGL